MDPCLSDDIPLGAVVSLISRGRSVFLNNRLRPLGLSAGQFPVLALLSREQDITQDRLVRHYRLDKGTIARAVRKLEDGGYIRRTTDPGNRRAVRLFLTRKGERTIPILQAINREWEERVQESLSSSERSALHALMRRTAGNSMAIMAGTGDDEHGSG
jgi:DNA-binding MarR family transcriptional regulator